MDYVEEYHKMKDRRDALETEVEKLEGEGAQLRHALKRSLAALKDYNTWAKKVQPKDDPDPIDIAWSEEIWDHGMYALHGDGHYGVEPHSPHRGREE